MPECRRIRTKNRDSSLDKQRSRQSSALARPSSAVVCIQLDGALRVIKLTVTHRLCPIFLIFVPDPSAPLAFCSSAEGPESVSARFLQQEKASRPASLEPGRRGEHQSTVPERLFRDRILSPSTFLPFTFYLCKVHFPAKPFSVPRIYTSNWFTRVCVCFRVPVAAVRWGPSLARERYVSPFSRLFVVACPCSPTLCRFESDGAARDRSPSRSSRANLSTLDCFSRLFHAADTRTPLRQCCSTTTRASCPRWRRPVLDFDGVPSKEAASPSYEPLAKLWSDH